jgi:hypothetical protein
VAGSTLRQGRPPVRREIIKKGREAASKQSRLMAETTLLLQESEVDLDRVGTSDVVFGLPTYNNIQTIDTVVEAAIAGLAASLDSRRAVLVNADGGSKDGTPERVNELSGGRVPVVQVRYPLYPANMLAAPLAGVPGRQEALGTIFRLARKMSAKACAVIDADLQSMTADWVDGLIRPVLEHDFDLVVPCYQRLEFEGTINYGIVYPFLRALYGKRVRQTISSDEAFSARMIDHYLGPDGTDAKLLSPGGATSVTAAICGGFKICQAFLGPRVLRPRETVPDLSATLAQVLTSLFEEMDRTAAYWQKVRGSEAVPSVGSACPVMTKPAQVNLTRMVESFRLGYQDLQEIWGLILPPATLLDLKRLARKTDADFQMADDVWARTVYDFALGFRLRVIGRDHLLKAMTPLYLGWVASFIGEMQTDAAETVEQRVERLCMAFEAQKRYLISRWRWPDRFNP